MWADILFDIRPDLLEQLRRQQHHARRAIADLGILRTCNVDERARSGVHDVEQLQDGRAVVGDGDFLYMYIIFFKGSRVR